jgi:hypothetical protein
MTTNKIYYVHISSQNVPHYFSLGLICPTILIENRNIDIQNNFCNEILISEKKWDKYLDCSIECVFIDEINLKELGNGYYSYNSFIPLSRIKLIFFSNKKMMENIIWSTNETASYLPDDLVRFERKIKEEISNIKINELEIKSRIEPELINNIEKFNKIIGGFAFSKLLRNNFIDPNLTYSNSYFELYKSLLNEIETPHIENENLFNGLFNKKESKWVRLKIHINKNISNDYVIKIALEKNIILKEKFNAIVFEKNIDDEEVYILSILATYGEGKPKTIEDFITDLGNNNFSTKFKETLTILLGFHLGYKKIRNYYNISKNNIPVKFELVSTLDYYTIEHIYNFVNNDKDLFSRTKYQYLPIQNTEKNIIDNTKYFGYYICNSNIIISIIPEFLSYIYIQNLIQKNATVNNNSIMEDYISSIYKIVELNESKKISFKNLIYKSLREILENITEQIKLDYDHNKQLNKKNNKKNKINKEAKNAKNGELNF